MSVVFTDTSKTWDECKYQIEPFDIILFSGNGCISDTIRFFEYEKLSDGLISHVGVVVNKKVLPFVEKLEDNKLYIWESIPLMRIRNMNINPIPDINGNVRCGVQIRELEKVIQCSNLNNEFVYIGKLKINPWTYQPYENYGEIKEINQLPKELMLFLILTLEDRKSIIQNNMETVMKEYGERYYDLNPADLLSTVYSIFKPFRYIKDTISYYTYKYFYGIEVYKNEIVGPLFCSEFVSIVYKSIKVLSDDVNPENITPIHFIIISPINPIPLILKYVFRIL